MRANKVKKIRRSRANATPKRPRRAQLQIPTLQMTMNARETDWTCPVCYARGSVEHAADASSDVVQGLVRASHAVKQPSCRLSQEIAS